MEAALAMCRALESLEGGYLPDEMTEGQDEPVWYNESKHAAAVVEFMIGVQKRASLFRVCFGMTVLLDSQNEIVDQELSHLELHPRLRACKSACKGIDTDVLERHYNAGGGIDSAMEEASLKDHVSAVMQRDKLLGVLKACDLSEFPYAREVIAEVEAAA